MYWGIFSCIYEKRNGKRDLKTGTKGKGKRNIKKELEFLSMYISLFP